MNTITYEEDLQKNPLYLKLMERESLLQEICINSWVVALPRKSSFAESSLKSHEFVLAHILSPSEELPRSHFINLIGDEVTINGQLIKCKDTPHTCTILFEEFYYTRDLQKLKILCIDCPLDAKFVKHTKSPSATVKSVQESAELIRQNCTKQVERKVDNAIKSFSLRTQKSVDYEQFRTNVLLLFNFCVNVSCNRRVKEDPFLAMNMRIALEYIIMDTIYDNLFDAITIKHSEESQRFNKVLKKLSPITLNDLNLSQTAAATKVTANLGILRMEMLKIDSSKSALDKLACFKNVIDAISALNGNQPTATDELLPILVYLVIKSNYFHFIPTLVFIKDFNLSQILNSQAHSVGSALLYVLTTLEAIVFFIQTNEGMSLERNLVVIGSESEGLNAGIDDDVGYGSNHGLDKSDDDHDNKCCNGSYESVKSVNLDHLESDDLNHKLDDDSGQIKDQSLDINSDENFGQIMSLKADNFPFCNMNDPQPNITFKAVENDSLDQSSINNLSNKSNHSLVHNSDLHLDQVSDPKTTHIFHHIRDNNEEQLIEYLSRPLPSSQSQSCHPLCTCQSCEALKSTSTVNQTFHNNLRMLHIASFCNVPKILSLLLAHDADVNAVDGDGFTAIHYAGMRGHQKVLFLLMHGNADINVRTRAEQTALMLAASNGHEHCVKALLFFAEHTHIAIDINAQDDEGMTALHYASQCGFDAIVDTLLEYQARATVKNQFGRTAVDCAHNSLVKGKLEVAVKYQVEELPISENEFVFIRKQDLADIFSDVS